MNIGIDARMYGLENAGIGRYIMNLTKHLFILDKHNHYTLFLRSKYARILKVPKNVSKVTANFRHYSVEEQTKFPKIIDKHKVDLMHFPHFNVPLLYNKPFVVTIHDLLWHKTRGLSVTSLSPIKYALKYLGYKAVVNHAIARAEKIFVPSIYVKKDVARYGGKENKMCVSYEGVDTRLSQTKPDNANVLLKKWQIRVPYVVYTGSAYPHKNLKKLIEAISFLENEGIKIQLVIISSRTVFLDTLKKYVSLHKLSKKVIFTGYLPDNQVKAMYKNAVALVHPSLSEGFGLTGLEAMSAGLPVLSSNASCLPEIYGEGALYFDPKEAKDIADKIKQLIENPPQREELIAKGKARSAEFSWEKMAKETLDVYHQIEATLA